MLGSGIQSFTVIDYGTLNSRGMYISADSISSYTLSPDSAIISSGFKSYSYSIKTTVGDRFGVESYSKDLAENSVSFGLNELVGPSLDADIAFEQFSRDGFRGGVSGVMHLGNHLVDRRQNQIRRAEIQNGTVIAGSHSHIGRLRKQCGQFPDKTFLVHGKRIQSWVASFRALRIFSAVSSAAASDSYLS